MLNSYRIFITESMYSGDYNGQIFYHGTTKTRAENIRQFGFYPQHNVNIIDDYEEAMEYANMLAEDEDDFPAIVKVRLKPTAKPLSDVGIDAWAYKSSDVIVAD